VQSILFIYSDSRVASVVDALRELTRVPITVASDFDSGLQEIFEKRPAQIFIQEEIGGTSCVAVAGHIKNLLRDNAPRIVLLRDDPGRKLVAGRDSFDDAIDLSGLTDDLLAEIRLRLEGVSGMQWREDVLPTDEEPVVQAPFDEAAVERAAAELMANELDLPLTLEPSPEFMAIPQDDESTEIPLAEHFAPVEPCIPPVLSEPEPAPEMVPDPVLPSLEQSLPSMEPVLVPEVAETAPVPMSVPAPVPVEVPAEVFPEEEVFQLEDALALRSQRRRLSRLYTVGFLVTLGLVAGWFFLGRTPVKIPVKPAAAPSSPSTATALPPPPVASSAVQPAVPAMAISLPPVLAAAALDPSYGDRRPGWERRTTADFEALVFRENGSIRALQVMARGSKGLANQVVAAVFQFAGGTAVVWQKEEKRGGLLVEQGMLPNRHEILRYSRPGVKSPAALVVAIP